jgi:hypothetical protein
MPFVENFHEFAIRHGGKFVTVDGNWLFSDGARACQNPFGTKPDLFDPPVDPTELLNNIRAYHLAKLHRAETDFQELKARLLEFPGNVFVAMRYIWKWNETEYGPEPSDADGKVWLSALQSIVMERREKVKVIDTRLANLPDVILRRKQAAKAVEAERQRREAVSTIQQEIASIEI